LGSRAGLVPNGQRSSRWRPTRVAVKELLLSELWSVYVLPQWPLPSFVLRCSSSDNRDEDPGSQQALAPPGTGETLGFVLRIALRIKYERNRLPGLSGVTANALGISWIARRRDRTDQLGSQAMVLVSSVVPQNDEWPEMLWYGCAPEGECYAI
jgi:hypothetical protein